MIDAFTFEQCKNNEEILACKIKTLEHAIEQSERMIVESKMNINALTFLRRKIADSRQDLEALYLLKAR